MVKKHSWNFAKYHLRVNNKSKSLQPKKLRFCQQPRHPQSPRKSHQQVNAFFLTVQKFAKTRNWANVLKDVCSNCRFEQTSLRTFVRVFENVVEKQTSAGKWTMCTHSWMKLEWSPPKTFKKPLLLPCKCANVLKDVCAIEQTSLRTFAHKQTSLRTFVQC